MKPFYIKYKKSIAGEALRSSTIIAVLAYIIFRIMFFDFSLSWQEEGFFFIKFFLGAVLGITAVTIAITMLYVSLLKLKRTGRAIARNADR